MWTAEWTWLGESDCERMLRSLPLPASDRKLRLFACAGCRRLGHLEGAGEYLRGSVEGVERFLAGETINTVDYVFLNNRRMFGAEEGFTHAFAHCGMLEESALESALGTARNVIRAMCDEAFMKRMDAVGDVTAEVQQAWRDVEEAENRALCGLLRDIFGNPFAPTPFHPDWRTETVVRLARAAHDERHLPAGTLDAERLLILADALEDAGCEEPRVLQHLRGFRECIRCQGTGRSPYDLGYSPPPREPCPDCGATGWLPSMTPHVRGCHVIDACLLLG